MKFSMNGFRKQLSCDVGRLRDLIDDEMQEHNLLSDDFIEAINDIITHSNVINCVFIEGDDSFSDLSHIEVEHIDH